MIHIHYIHELLVYTS